MPPPAPATKAPLKILLVRDETLGHRVRSLMADESTLYWRSSDPPKDLETSLGEEHFGLIIADYRETKTDVLDAVEALRKRQPDAQIILICKKLELEEIIHAIRLGVRDVFNPPLDFKSLAGRIESLVRSGDKFPGMIEETALGRWGELAMHLSEAPAPAQALAPAIKAPGRRGGASSGTDPQLEALVQERDNLANEVKTLKKNLGGAEEAQRRLQEELAWTATLTEHAKNLDQEVHQLRQDQETSPEEPKRRSEAEAALAGERRRVEELQAALAQQANSQAAKTDGLAAEQLEVERAMIEQQRQAVAKQHAALQEEAKRLDLAGKNLVQESARREQTQKDESARLAAAGQKLESEQALARQAAAEAEAALKAEKARLEKAQAEIGLQAAKAEKLAAEQTEQSEVERAILDQQRRAMVKQRAMLQEEATRLETAAKNLAQESTRLQAEVEKTGQEGQVKEFAACGAQFEQKRRQFEEQLKEFLSV